MGTYFAQVGEVIIKPDCREDFGRFVREEYEKIKDTRICDFIDEWSLIEDKEYRYRFFLPLKCWKHYDYKDEWVNKYITNYDEQTGHFTYGVCYKDTSKGYAMYEFFELLDEIVQEKIFVDYGEI